MFAMHAIVAPAASSGATAYRYWRFAFTGGHGSRTGSKEMRVSDDCGSTTIPPNLTSESSASPYVVSTNSVRTPGSTDLWEAFDSDPTTSSWVSNSDQLMSEVYWQIDLGSGNEKALDYWIATWPNTLVAKPPTGFNVLASDTGAFAGEEVTIHTEAGLANVADDTVVEYTW